TEFRPIGCSPSLDRNPNLGPKTLASIPEFGDLSIESAEVSRCGCGDLGSEVLRFPLNCWWSRVLASGRMRGPSEPTKVVARRLPPSISQSVLMEQIDGRFAGRYDWVCFRPGKNSQKNQRHSRAYLNFKRAEDVVEFAEFFDQHIFVNEKGAQFKALVEYAPSQRVPKQCPKKDVREGTISKDPEYMEFLELVSKPLEHLPSAEIQLERKEAERAGSTKETPIVTPLMDFVRRKRAAKNGPQKLSGGGKVSRRASGASAGISSPSKRSSEKRKIAASTYVIKDSTKKGSAKDKPTYILMSRRDQHLAVDKSVSVPSAVGKEASEDEFASGAIESGKSRLVLLKGKEKEVSNVSRSLVRQPSVRNSPTPTSRQNQPSGRIIRGILSKEGLVDQPYASESHPDLQTQMAKVKDKRLPRPPNASSNMKDYISHSSSLASVSDGDDKKYIDDKVAINNKHGSVSISEKYEKRTRNRDRPDRGVWAPLRRSDRSQSNDGVRPYSEAAQATNSLESIPIFQQATGKVGEVDMVVPNACVGHGNNSHTTYETSLGHGERKADLPSANRSEDMKIHGGGRVDFSSMENGSHRHVGRRGSARGSKEMDSSLNLSEGKSSKRASTVYSTHEVNNDEFIFLDHYPFTRLYLFVPNNLQRQVWVQKSGSAS
ncbi:unnamed protein product, partial [Musa hybrid cultivar]